MNKARQIRQAAATHCQEVINPNVESWEANGTYPRDAIRLAADAGLLGLYAPTEFGGQGLSMAEGIPVFEELGKGEGLYAFSLSMHNIVTYAICGFGQPALRDVWGPRMTAGEALGGFVLTEPQSGSDAAGLRTFAVINDDGSYTISGRKAWVSLAGEADVYAVVVKTSPEPGHKDMAMVAIPAGTPGLSFGEPYQKIAGSFLPIADMHLDEVTVPAENVILPPGKGLSGSLFAIDIARTSIAAGCCGLMSTALDAALAFARDRQLFGKSELSLQGIRWMLADVATDLEASRLLYKSASEQLGTPEGSLMAAHAKRFAPDAAVRASGACLQVLGGYGLLKSYALERLFRLAPVMKLVDGSTEIQRVVIGRALEKRARTLDAVPIPGLTA